MKILGLKPILKVAMTEIILASGSPRRKELLTRLGIQFRVRSADVDESSLEPDPQTLVQFLANKKARAVQSLEPERIILAADTVVAFEGQILQKPVSKLENADFIRTLSGVWHEVFTGVCILTPSNQALGFERTRVKFRDLSSQEILGYANSGEGLDKAGGYGIQEMGMALVEKIEGDFFNVVGLPISKMITLAHSLKLELLPWATPELEGIV
jgi:septum formation protein